MKKEYIEIFQNSISSVFANFGLGEVSSKNTFIKETLTCRYNLTTIIGLSGDLKGNIAFSMPYDVAKKIVSCMMMGMEVNELDEMAVSALGEMTNMICGQAVSTLSTHNLSVDITPPTILHGNNMKVIISQVETSVSELVTSIGEIELNLGIE